MVHSSAPIYEPTERTCTPDNEEEISKVLEEPGRPLHVKTAESLLERVLEVGQRAWAWAQRRLPNLGQFRGPYGRSIPIIR
ncbi:hypothetical protein AVEN_208102-1 [Araneus ventricosus]|uniref:Uncharacterized protein n=1 Tax=Araneus ventricosus TaxID=182803 RepID=A0A4Y2FZ53_ARAVE|nr:hypothetical protein AVEN_208102-1 [Araneus ventricosus]